MKKRPVPPSSAVGAGVRELLRAQHEDDPFGGFGREMATPAPPEPARPAPEPLRIPPPDWEAASRSPFRSTGAPPSTASRSPAPTAAERSHPTRRRSPHRPDGPAERPRSRASLATRPRAPAMRPARIHCFAALGQTFRFAREQPDADRGSRMTTILRPAWHSRKEAWAACATPSPSARRVRGRALLPSPSGRVGGASGGGGDL
jgi:hypothetical protein